MDTPKTASPAGVPSSATPHPHAGSVSPAQISGEERRRSQRVLLRVRAVVHVAVQGNPVSLDVFTLSVNAHGALVVLKENLPSDTQLILEHASTRERIPCRVVRPPHETSDGFHTAIEFDSANPGFWKIAFPPANWRAEDL